MLPQLIPLTICSVVALGAALVAVVRRDALQSTVFLATMCLGVAGLFLLLEAPAIAGPQFIFVVGLLFLMW